MNNAAWKRHWPAPAKLNLMLHVVGRRADGYHLLQTVFRLIDLADTLVYSPRDDSAIRLSAPIPGVPEDTDLTVRAARLLQMSQAEVRNRCTITGAVEIARLPGAVQLTVLAPLSRLDELGLGKLVRRQYGLA